MKSTTQRQSPAVQPSAQTYTGYDNHPIGIFDSGIGGLTVVKEILKQLPNESIIYLGDTARVPYGTKSERTIRAFALQCCLFLLEHNVKMIIIACNTASAVALDFIANMFRIPVIGVIQPGALRAIQNSASRHIGVIGTHSTINSQAYTKMIQAFDPAARIISKACPLFVPLAEEGWLDSDITAKVCQEYLRVFEKTNIDTLVMGCTHYPLLSAAIQKTIDRIVGKPVCLVDSGVETARAARAVLLEKNMENKGKKIYQKYYVTDLPANFLRVGELFLGSKIEQLEMVSVETLGF